jgi:hypothetical protein
MTLMTEQPSNEPSPLELVSRIAAALPSTSPAELDALADAVEALTDAIGLQRDWAGGGGA